MPDRYFKVHPWWLDETVYIIAGGPSVKNVDLSLLKGRKIMTVNNAYSLVKPDVIFFADGRWWKWHKDNIALDFPGRIISTQKVAAHLADPRVCRMGRDYRFTQGGPALSLDQTLLAGPDSGYMAINLAVLMGVSRIVLIGYDMGFTEGQAHWHEDHPIKTNESDYLNIFAPKYPALIEAVKKHGVEVYRVTPSRLDFIPQVTLEETFQMPKRQRSRVS